jgi:predicted Zn-dependent protease
VTVVGLLAAGALSLGVALTSSDASGQKAEGAKAAAAKPTFDAGDRRDPDNVTALSPFMETVVKGNELYAAKDFMGAIDTFKRAVKQSPRNALGPYLLGEAYLATNNLTEAEAAFKAAEELNDPKFPMIRSHVLFAVADCFEREKKWEQARVAWKVYSDHAAKLGADGGAFPESGAARLKVVDDWLALDKRYALVRQRIAAEKVADAGAEAGKPGAPAKK